MFEWIPFSKKHPEENKIVTIIWSNGAQTDCTWVSEGIWWNSETLPVPIFWKYFK